MTITQSTPYLLALLDLERQRLQDADSALTRLRTGIEMTDLTLFGLAFDREEDSEADQALFADLQDVTAEALPEWSSLIARRTRKCDLMSERLQDWALTEEPTAPLRTAGASRLAEALLRLAELRTPLARSTATTLVCEVLMSHLADDRFDIVVDDLGKSLSRHLDDASILDEPGEVAGLGQRDSAHLVRTDATTAGQ